MCGVNEVLMRTSVARVCICASVCFGARLCTVCVRVIKGEGAKMECWVFLLQILTAETVCVNETSC